MTEINPLGYFRLRRRMTTDPAATVLDPSVRATDALGFAITKVYLAIAVGSLFSFLIGLVFADIVSVWSVDGGTGIDTVAAIIRPVLNSIVVPFASILAARYTVAFGLPKQLKAQLGTREARRRYLLADGSVGLLALVLLTAHISIGGSIVALQDRAGYDLWDHLGMRDGSETTNIAAVAALVVFAISMVANIIAFIRTGLIFARSVRPVAEHPVSLLRILSISALARGVATLLMVGVFMILPVVLATPLYVGALWCREQLGLPNVVTSSQVISNLEESWGARGPEGRPASPATLASYSIYFDNGSDTLSADTKHKLASLARAWQASWRRVGVDSAHAGHIAVTGYSGATEDAFSATGRDSLAQRRAWAVEYVLATNGVPPRQTLHLVIPSRSETLPDLQRVDLTWFVPVPTAKAGEGDRGATGDTGRSEPD
jgi:outer membrane protein OmpA-like peptidoglycan-associated protein